MKVLEPRDGSVASASSTGFLLGQLGREAMRCLNDALKPTGLKPPQIGVLVELRSGSIWQQALSEATGMDAVKLVGILNDLESAGLVERNRDAIDRRRHIVAITPAGLDRLQAVDRATATAEDQLLSALDPAQRELLAGLLRRVIETRQVAAPCPTAADLEAGSDPCRSAEDSGCDPCEGG